MAKFAVIAAAGAQHLVAEGETLTIDRHAALEPGKNFDFTEVLLIGDEKSATVGTPTVAGAKVSAKVVSHGRTPKKLWARFEQRGNINKTGTVRADVTTFEIVKISAPAAKSAASADEKPAEKKAPAKKSAAKKDA